jgi:hypothetical protein
MPMPCIKRGELEQARVLWEEAEAVLAKETDESWLHSLPGLRYCDLLLDEGRACGLKEPERPVNHGLTLFTDPEDGPCDPRNPRAG